MKLFETTDIEIVNYCQDIFRFAHIKKKRFLPSYSSGDNSICRHILIGSV